MLLLAPFALKAAFESLNQDEFNNEKSLTDSLESSPLMKYITSKSLLDKPHSKPTVLFKAVTFLSNMFVFPH